MKEIKDMSPGDWEQYVAGIRIAPTANLYESVRRMADEKEQKGEASVESHAHAGMPRVRRRPVWPIRLGRRPGKR